MAPQAVKAHAHFPRCATFPTGEVVVSIPSWDVRFVLFFVLETIRTGAMRVIHIPVKTEETQRLRIEFVLYCPICALNLKIKRAKFCRK